MAYLRDVVEKKKTHTHLIFLPLFLPNIVPCLCLGNYDRLNDNGKASTEQNLQNYRSICCR